MSELVKKHILLIYSSQKVLRSLKFCTALHILVLHMHLKFDVDSMDSFLDMEEQSMRQKERKKERRKNREYKEHQGQKQEKSSSLDDDF